MRGRRAPGKASVSTVASARYLDPLEQLQASANISRLGCLCIVGHAIAD